MSQNWELQINEGDLIPSPTTNYRAEKLLGQGAYGMVVQCMNMTTGERVAVKVIKSTENIDCAQEEEVILQTMKNLRSDNFNIVTLYESFFFREHYCLAFELLDMDLQRFTRISPGQHLHLKEIRPILQQLATALDFLNSAGIIHADLKPENIMMVDNVRKPLKVKVIDFGIALDDPEEMIGQTLQTLWYRSPEILYEDHFSGNIDVWSLGCIAAELSMGSPLFPAYDKNDLIRQIAFAITDPQHGGHLRPHAFWPRSWMEGRFMATHQLRGEEVQAEYFDLQCFMDLLKQMLMMSQYERITPSRILQHPFITMSHLQGSYKNSLYLKSCEELMDICKDPSSEAGGHGDQVVVILQMSVKEESSCNTASPAKEGSKEDAKSGNRPDVSQAKKVRRSKSGKTGPIQRKRKRGTIDPTTDKRALTKKRKMGPAGMTDEKHSKMDAQRGNRPEDSKATVRRSERLAASQKGASGQTGPIRLKRMREDEDSDGQNRFVRRMRVELGL